MRSILFFGLFVIIGVIFATRIRSVLTFLPNV